MPTSKRFAAGAFAALLAATLPAAAATPPEDAAASGPLEATLAGEYALQGGQLQEAATWYLRAARAAPGDAALAERTARIALLAGDDGTAAAALALWQERAAATPAMRAIETSLALRRGDEAKATSLAIALASMGEDGWRHALNALGSGGKDLALAGRVLGAVVDADAIPPRLDPWLAFGGLAQRLDQTALAKRIVDEVVARFPDEPRVALLRASQQREAGDVDAARATLAQVEAVAVGDEELRLALASEYDALGDPTAAAAVLARGPQDEYTLRLRAALLAQADDKASLAALYAELQEDSARPDPQRRLLLGQVAEFLELREEALRWYRSVPGGPARLQARLRIAALLHALDRDAEAFAALHALQADADAHEDARRDAYLLEAELHRDAGDPEAEIDAFARGLAAYPDDPDLLYARALAWERRDDIARAEADFRQILVAQPDNVAALNALGYTLADRTDRHVEALELIDRARVAEPDNAAIIDSYGWVLYRLGRHEEALVELRRAFALQKDAEIASHIAEVLWVTGRRDEAREFFDKARELDPESRALQRALEQTVDRAQQGGDR
ncbi:MAG TPA: tetratricopeptide repeat protein [Xanthomonadaceae bacterium]|nr:tetratricopeptide repeat protein [Xanthomonadaceae bacterium]